MNDVKCVGRVSLISLIFGLSIALSGPIAFSIPPETSDVKTASKRLQDSVAPIMNLGRIDLEMRGAASCAAAACHGGPHPGVASPQSLQSSEYSLWIEHDPHAKSWRTMSSLRSESILTKLGILKSGKIVKREAYQNCLSCHNTAREIADDRVTPKIMEGVGCEACHGPSQNWTEKHYREDWSGQD